MLAIVQRLLITGENKVVIEGVLYLYKSKRGVRIKGTQDTVSLEK